MRIWQTMSRAGFMLALLVLGATGAGSAWAQNQPMRRIDQRIDVTSSVKLPGKIEIAATVFLPDPAGMGERPIAVFALPGGGLSRHYFDVRLAGRTGYSQAEHHVAQGQIFVAVDHLGVGDSSTTSLDTMRIEDIAAANSAAVHEIARRIEQGTLSKDFPAMPRLFKVGIGQSMGGGVTIIMQGRHRTYDAIAALGYSAIHTVLPQKTEAERLRVMAAQSSRGARWTDPKALSHEDSKKIGIDYIHYAFWDDVPQDIIDAKLKGGYPVSSAGPNWVSRTVPNCVIAMMAPGYVAEEAAHVTVPVLVGMGERDVAMTPLAEPAAYQSATDVSVFIVPRLGHTHNLGTTRNVLWDRIIDWSRAVSREY